MKLKLHSCVLGAVLALTAGAAMNANALLTPIGSFSEYASASNPAAAGSFDPIAFVPLTVGGIGGAVSFTSPIAGTLVMTVTDCCLVGDVYQAFVDGTSLGFTSFVAIGGPTGSAGTFTDPISAGSHTFDITDVILSYIGGTSPFGGTVTSDYSPAGLTVDLAVYTVPEPSTYALLLCGLGLVAVAARRRRLI